MRRPRGTAEQHMHIFPENAKCVKVLNPMEPWRINWDIGMLLMIVYVMVVTPFELTFVSGERPYNAHNMGLFVCNRIVDIFFIFDFCMNFARRGADSDSASVSGALVRSFVRSFLPSFLRPFVRSRVDASFGSRVSRSSRCGGVTGRVAG